MPRVKQPTILDKPVLISQKMANFMGLNEPTSSRADVTRFVVQYIERNCTFIINNEKQYMLDEKVSNLFNFKEFQRAVQQGKIVWKRRNSETGNPMDVVETDDTFSFSKLQYMLSFHFGAHSKELKVLNDKCTELGLPTFDVYPYPLQVEEVENLWKYRPGDEKYQEAEKHVNGDDSLKSN